MSRTHKDKKWKLRYPENDHTFGCEKVACTVEYISYYTGEKVKYTSYRWFEIAGAKTKKKRSEYGDWNWMQSTPSAWTNTFMTRPKRRACRVWEQRLLTQDIEEADCPDYGRKPHIYYW